MPSSCGGPRSTGFMRWWRRNGTAIGYSCSGIARTRCRRFLAKACDAGIRDAANLIWKLLLVEKSGASRSLLSTYQDERKIHVQNVVAQAKELGLVIGELDVAAATARD